MGSYNVALYGELLNWNLKFTLISSVVLSLLLQLMLRQELNTLFTSFFEWCQLLWKKYKYNSTFKSHRQIQNIYTNATSIWAGIIFSYWSLSQAI